MNGMIGFNPEVAINFVKQLNQIDDRRWQMYVNYVNNIHNLIAETWYAPTAVSTMIEIDTAFSDACNQVGHVLFAISQDVRYAFYLWCRDTQTDPSNYPFPQGNTPPTSDQKEMEYYRSDGFVGVIAENIPQITSGVKNWQTQMNDLLNTCSSAINSCSNMFYGGQQMETAIEWLNKAKTLANQKIDETTNLLLDEMQKTEEKYKQTAQANAQRFAGGN